MAYLLPPTPAARRLERGDTGHKAMPGVTPRLPEHNANGRAYTHTRRITRFNLRWALVSVART